MKLVKITALATFLGLCIGTANAGDIEKGKALSGQCVACHGAEGISPADIWPNLAGQKQGYLEKQLHDFRDGNRTDPMMSMMAKPLSDDDIADLAAYFSSL